MSHQIRLRNLLCVGLCVLVLAGCRSATTRLHSLSMLPPAQGAVLYAGPAVRVDAVHLPADMDRAEITTRSATGGLAIQEFDHWSAPLPKMAQQTLAADLVARLPPGKVILAPLDKPDGALGLNVVILRFSTDVNGAVFVASWQASAGRRRIRNGSSHHSAYISGTITRAAEIADQRRSGKIVNRNAAVSRSITIRSTKFAVICTMSCLSRDSSTSTTTSVSDSAPDSAGRRNSAIQKKFRIPQDSKKPARAGNSVSV